MHCFSQQLNTQLLLDQQLVTILENDPLLIPLKSTADPLTLVQREPPSHTHSWLINQNISAALAIC